jgi:phage tail P2-like protein
MAERPKRPDLQAFELTRRERAFVDVDARFEGVDIDLVRRVKSVAEAPAEYLPYLAWERSVDVYDPAWPEAVKRAVVAAAPEVHRYKGTRHAVEVALGALGLRTEIVEWWQEAPRAAPYTFRVTAFTSSPLYDGPLLDARLIRVAFAAIDRAKPLSRAYTMTIAASLPAALGLVPMAVAVTKTGAALHPRNEDSFAAGLGLVPIAVGLARVSALMIASP